MERRKSTRELKREAVRLINDRWVYTLATDSVCAPTASGSMPIGCQAFKIPANRNQTSSENDSLR